MTDRNLIIRLIRTCSVEHVISDIEFIVKFIKTPQEGWADPGSTAIPGQPVEKSEQASASSPGYKNQFNIEVPQWGTYQILS